jgi:hypothetical protein
MTILGGNLARAIVNLVHEGQNEPRKTRFPLPSHQSLIRCIDRRSVEVGEVAPGLVRLRPVAEVHTVERPWHMEEMPASVSRGVYRHGKRHRFVVTARDDSPEAFRAALAELDRKVGGFTDAIAPKVTRQSYRKNKTPKEG